MELEMASCRMLAPVGFRVAEQWSAPYHTRQSLVCHRDPQLIGSITLFSTILHTVIRFYTANWGGPRAPEHQPT